MISKKTKEAILRRSGGLCEICHGAGDFRALAIHHKQIKGMGGRKDTNNPEDYEHLCGKCHSARHNIKEVEDDR